MRRMLTHTYHWTHRLFLIKVLMLLRTFNMDFDMHWEIDILLQRFLEINSNIRKFVRSDINCYFSVDKRRTYARLQIQNAICESIHRLHPLQSRYDGQLSINEPWEWKFCLFCQLSIFLTVIYHHKYIISCDVFPREFWLVPSEIGIELDVAGVM